jgi:hypothetical protein
MFESDNDFSDNERFLSFKEQTDVVLTCALEVGSR